MKQIALSVVASGFFGYMTAKLLLQVDWPLEVEAGLTGFVGYMGGLSVDLVITMVCCYYKSR